MTIEQLRNLTDQPFECIVTDTGGQILFCMPIPGHPELDYYKDADGYVGLITGTPDNMDPWIEAWTEYIASLQAKKPKEKIPRRTRKQAQANGAIIRLPEQLASPTLDPYQHAITTVANPTAHLQPITKELADKLRFQDGKLYFAGMDTSTSGVDLVQYYDNTQQAVSKLDLQTLRALYTVVLQDLANMLQDVDTIAAKAKDPQYIGHTVKIYLSDFLVMLGYGRNMSKDARDFAIAKIASYNNVLGIMSQTVGGRTYRSVYPVMMLVGYNDKDGTLSFSSPYINKVIMDIAKASIELDKQGNPKLKTNGKPYLKPAYHYYVKSSIAKERNQRAAEIVNVIATLIAQTGDDNVPHIKASTIIDRVPDLKYAIETASSSNKTMIIKRAFDKAWDMLWKQTVLQQTYQNLRIRTIIDKHVCNGPITPTAATADITVYEFPHDGKFKHSP